MGGGGDVCKGGDYSLSDHQNMSAGSLFLIFFIFSFKMRGE